MDIGFQLNRLAAMAMLGVMLADDIRNALRKTDQTIAALSESTGIHRVNLSQFKAGTRNLPLLSLELLAESLGIKIIAIPRKTKKSG